jgi:hypothetical protein
MRWLAAFCVLGTALVPASTLGGEMYPFLRVTMPDPPFIRVVGMHLEGDTLVPDPAGAFTVAVRDIANNPVGNVPVIIDFSFCPDIALCATPVAGQTVDCLGKTVRALTDIVGIARFTVLGAANNDVGVSGVAAPGAGLDGVRILDEDGGHLVIAGYVTAVALDQNGAVGGNGVSAQDLAFFSVDLGSAIFHDTYRGRSDYNFDEVNSALDLAAYLTHLGAAILGTGSGVGCPGAAYCP